MGREILKRVQDDYYKRLLRLARNDKSLPWIQHIMDYHEGEKRERDDHEPENEQRFHSDRIVR